MRGASAAIYAVLFVLPGVAADTRPFVESDPAELARTLPELSGLHPGNAPASVDALLREVAGKLAATAALLPPASLAESIHEMHFEEGGILAASRRQQASYTVSWTPSGWRDIRASLPAGEPAGFFITAGFQESLNFLLPPFLEETRFVYLGRATENGRESLVIAYLRPVVAPGRQGLLWIDEATLRVVRVRQSLYGRIEGVPLDTWNTDIRLASNGLLSQVTVLAAMPGRELLTVHRYDSAPVVEEPLEQMARATALTQQGQAAAAVTLLKDAQRRDPQRPAIRFHLGAALQAAGDAPAAEAEWRAAVKAMPDSAPAHNTLGIALYQRGDLSAAAAEFREVIRLQPANATARDNLAKAQVSGDTIRVDVHQVLVPVVVTSDDGHFATDLKQADFHILEDGVEQKITSFGVEHAGLQTELTKPPAQSAAPRPGSPTAAPGPRRTYLLCLDTLHSSLITFTQVRQSLIKLFKSERKGESQFALIAVGATLQVMQNMTTDPELILRALEDKAFQKMFQTSRAGSATAELEQFERSLAETRTACDTHDPQCAPRRASLPNVAASIAGDDRIQTTNYLASLRSLVEQLGRSGGRRTMVLISAGFQMTPGRDAYELLSAYFPELRGIQMRTMDRIDNAMEPVFRLASQNNVTIHTIDSRGLYTSSYQESYRRNAGGSVAPAVERALNRNASEAGGTLDEIAAATGGTAFRNNNDMLAGLTRAIADGRDYYLLSYVPSNAAADGKFRAITVHVRDGKYGVRAKRGYWAAGQ